MNKHLLEVVAAVAVPAELSPVEFLRALYAMHAPELDRATFILSYFNKLLRGGYFACADLVLGSLLDIKQLSPAELLAVISITSHARPHLANYNDFMARVEPYFVEKVGAERAAALLKNRRWS